MELLINPARKDWPSLCLRPSSDNPEVVKRVNSIIERVRKDGDLALKQIAEEIDAFIPDSLEVTKDELLEASDKVSAEVKQAIETAGRNIAAFHKAQLPREIEVETQKGVRCIQRPVPISRVGIYIPGGTAPLFSTVLMLAIPARCAGCKEIIMCTPCGKDGKVAPEVLYSASVCGVDRIFKTGGAQAIAAMAYGTGSIPAVDKIFGPGNQYVTTAKQLLGNRITAIDMPAGPSEVMVLCDDSTDPRFAAADLLSQAEHGADSQVMLVSDSIDGARAVMEEVERQTETLDRADYIRKSLSKSRFIVFDEKKEMVDFANTYGPEHLIVSLKDAWSVVDQIYCAGSVFVGAYTPESAGDYASGTNHTLPTCAWARSYSGVNIDSFLKKMTIQEISGEGLKGLAPTIVAMAEAEGLHAHANAVTIRCGYEKK